MNYLKPYVDEFITDTYGSAVGVINPEAKYKVVIEGMPHEQWRQCIDSSILPKSGHYTKSWYQDNMLLLSWLNNELWFGVV